MKILTLIILVLSMTQAFSQPLPIDKDNLDFFGKGRMKGNVVFIEVPKELVQSWMPRGLILAKQNWTREGYYPIAIMLMQQQDVFFGFKNQPTSPHNFDLGTYLETIIWAPFVQIDPMVYPKLDSKITYSHMIKLFLNAQAGLEFGINYYGINKYLANMEQSHQNNKWLPSEQNYKINNEDGTPQVEAKFSIEPTKTLEVKNINFLMKITKALSQPYIFKHPNQNDIICAEVKWGFLKSIVSSSQYTLELTDQLVPGLGNLTLSSANDENSMKSMGSFFINIPWKFSGPQSCQ